MLYDTRLHLGRVLGPGGLKAGADVRQWWGEQVEGQQVQSRLGWTGRGKLEIKEAQLRHPQRLHCSEHKCKAEPRVLRSPGEGTRLEWGPLALLDRVSRLAG